MPPKTTSTIQMDSQCEGKTVSNTMGHSSYNCTEKININVPTLLPPNIVFKHDITHSN